jgi:hypothetical protein
MKTALTSSSLTPRRLVLKCARRGCTAAATRAPKLHVPVSKADAKPVSVVVSLHLCRLHGFECRAADLLNDDIRIAVANAALPALPIFTRAYVSLVPLTDPDFLEVSRRRHQAEGH